MVKTIQSRKEFFIQFDDEELKKLGIKEGDRFSVEGGEDGSLKFTPLSEIKLDFSQFSREQLELFISKSCDKDVSVNEIISEILKEFIEKNEDEEFDGIEIENDFNFPIRYNRLLKEGTFFEKFPNATGNWKKDLVAWHRFLDKVGIENNFISMEQWLKHATKENFGD